MKIERLESDLKKEISHILSTEIKNNTINFVTITGCKITNDLSYAKVYFTVLNDDKKEEIAKELQKASKFIRGRIAEKINVRHTPEIIFKYDDSIEYGNRIEEKLKEIQNKNIS